MQLRSDPRLTSIDFAGLDGLGRLSSAGGAHVPDVRLFHAHWTGLQADSITLGELSTSPITGLLQLVTGPPAAAIAVVVDGYLSYRIGSHHFDAETGSAHLLRSTEHIQIEVPVSAAVHTVSVPPGLLPEALQSAVVTSTGKVERTLLISSLALAIEAVLSGATSGTGSPASQAIRPLAMAALEESLPISRPQDPRRQLADYIDMHLAEKSLGPQSIAMAFGISIRWAHHIFNVDGETIAQYIRSRRLESVVAQLREETTPSPLGILAARNGFPSRDQLTRSFKSRYGVTVSQFREST